ncbi:hypothetical protein FQZ97_1054520 [compost metagenome]
MHRAHERCKVGLDARTVHERRADDDDFHARFCSDLAQALFGFHLGDAIGVLRGGRVRGGEGLTCHSAFAVDFDGAHEDEAAHAGSSGLPREVDGALHIGATELA